MRARWRHLAPLLASAWVALAPLSGRAASPLFSDDVESGTLLQSATPPGQWSTCFPAPCDMFSATAQAAHRGSFGVRITDADAGTGNGLVNGLKEAFPAPVSGDLYWRAWFRFSTSSTGTLKIALLTVQNDLDSVIHQMSLELPAGTVVSGGFELVDGQPKFVIDGTSQVLSQGEWHLVEVALLGLATAQGQRLMWIDRAELFSHPIDWSGGEGWTATKFVLGELNGDRAFVGTLDYDDVVADVTPLPSHLAVVAPPRAVVSGCVPLTVQARDTPNDAPADARHPLAITLHAQGAGNLYASADCSGTGGGNTLGIAMPAGQSGATASFLPLQRGVIQLSAEDPDLLPSAPAGVTITGPASQLAFTTAAPLAHPGACSPELHVELEDDAGSPVVDGLSHSVTLDAPVPLFGDPGCQTAITALAIPAGASGGALHFLAGDAGTFTLAVSAPGLASASQLEEASAPVALLDAPAELTAGGTFTLDGRGSTPSRGAQLNGYQWRELRGPTGVLLASQPSQTLTLKEPGDYLFELRVTDTAGLTSAPVQRAITVMGPSPAVPTLGCAAAGEGPNGLVFWLSALFVSLLPRRRAARACGAACADRRGRCRPPARRARGFRRRLP